MRDAHFYPVKNMINLKRFSSVLATVFLLVFAAAPAARAQQSESRFAFVIGNDGYESAPLATAANDAGLVAETLRSAGFDVTGARNLDQETFRAAYREFLDKVAATGPGAVAAIYVSGYGLQVDGENYLVPVGGRVLRDADVALEALRISDLTRPLIALPGRAHIIILDLAHAGPFAQQGQPLAPGLALVEGEPNTLIAFNAAPGLFAPAASGDYSAYARALSEMLRVPGLPLDDVFARVRTRVAELTRGAVTPWHVSKLDPAYRLLEATPGAPEQITTAEIATARSRPIREFTAAEAYAATLDRDTISAYEEFLVAFPTSPYAKNVRGILAARREAITWRRSAAANNANAYWSYLRRYPSGPHAPDARRRLVRLTAPLEPPQGSQLIEYDVGPPSREEAAYFDVPAPLFYDADAPAPQPPRFMPPPPQWYAPPPPPSREVIIEEVYFLPTPAAPPPPPWVAVPNYVAQPVEYDSLRQRREGGSIVPYVAIPAALAAGIIAGKLMSNRNARQQSGQPMNTPGGLGSAPGQPFMPSVAAPPRPSPGGLGAGRPPGVSRQPAQPGQPSGGNNPLGLQSPAPLQGGPVGLPGARQGLPPAQGLPPGQGLQPARGAPQSGAPRLQQGGGAGPGQGLRPSQALPGQALPGQPFQGQVLQGQPLSSGGNPAELRRQQMEQRRLLQQQRFEQQRQFNLERQQKLQAEREQRRQQLIQNPQLRRLPLQAPPPQQQQRVAPPPPPLQPRSATPPPPPPQQQRLAPPPPPQQRRVEPPAPPPQQRIAPPPPQQQRFTPPPSPPQQRVAPPPPPPQQRAVPPPAPPPQQRAAPPPPQQQRQPEKPKCGLPGLPACPR